MPLSFAPQYDPGDFSAWYSRYDAHQLPILPGGGSYGPGAPHGGSYLPGVTVFPASDMPGTPVPLPSGLVVATPGQPVNTLQENGLAPLLILGVVALLALQGKRKR